MSDLGMTLVDLGHDLASVVYVNVAGSDGLSWTYLDVIPLPVVWLRAWYCRLTKSQGRWMGEGPMRERILICGQPRRKGTPRGDFLVVYLATRGRHND